VDYLCVFVPFIGHTLNRNSLIKHIIEGKTEGRIEVTERRVGRRKQLLDGLKGKRECCKLREEEPDSPSLGHLAVEEAIDLSYDREWNDEFAL
jgi:hypothetical protein